MGPLYTLNTLNTLIAVLLAFSTVPCAARTPDDDHWVLALEGTAGDATGKPARRRGTGRWPRVVRGVSNGVDGGIYISGSFFGEVVLGGVELSSTGRADVLVGRIDSRGRVVWLQGFGGPGTDISPDIVEDSMGRALVTGMVGARARIGGRSVETRGGSDAFTAQLSPDGDVLWLHTTGGAASDSGNEIATDDEDNVLVAANSYGPVTAGNTTLEHRGGMDGFLLKYSAHGRLLWARQIAGPADDQLRGIAADTGGHVAVVGEFTGRVGLGGQSLTAASDQRDVLVARYTPLGALLWSRRFGGPGEDYARGVDVDESGNLYVTGVFTGLVNFGGITLEGGGNRPQLFVMRISPAGEVQWARGITGTGRGHGCEMDVNEPGDILISCDVSGQLGVAGMSVGAAGRRDSFVAVFDADGKARKLVALGASVSAANFDIVGEPTGRTATLVGVFRGALAAGSGELRSASEHSSYISRIALGDAARE